MLSVDVAADNERFASCGGDRAVFLWDVAAAATIRRFGGNLHGHSSRVNVVRFAGDPAGGVLASGGFDTTVKLWDCRSGAGGSGGKPIQSLGEATDSVTSLVVRGPEVVAGSVDGRVRTYDIRTGKVVVDVLGASVTSLDLTKDGRALLVGGLGDGGGGGGVRLMDRDTGSCLRSYAAPGRRNAELRVQAVLGGKEKYVLAGDESAGDDGGDVGRLWVWDLLTGRVAAKLAVPWGPPGYEGNRRKRAVGRDGKEKERTNVVSCVAWRDGGWGDQFCVGGTSGVVTVYGNLKS